MSDSRHRRALWVPVCAGLVALSALAWGQNAEPPPGVLMLDTGQIVEGRITRAAAGYMVERPGGSLLVPFQQVKFEATDRIDAWRKLGDTLPPKSTVSHLALARWCISVELYDQAEEELRACLKLNPGQPEALVMLRQLNHLRSAEQAPLAPPPAVPRTPDGFETPEVRSLGGLSRDVAREFTTRIQPILLNKCGNAACHGSAADNPFRLTYVRLASTSHRVYAERNLAEALRYVDLDKPRHSPLLMVPQAEDHGGGTRPIFFGPKGAEQVETLRHWVRTVAAEQGRSIGRERNSSSLVAEPGAERPVRSAVDASRSGASERRPTEEPPMPSDPEAPDEPDPLPDVRPDAFDPDVFNRAVHGGSVLGPPAVRRQGR